MKQGSNKFLRVSDIVSFPWIMRDSKVGPIPVVIDVWKEPGLLVELDHQKCGGLLRTISELVCDCRKGQSKVSCWFLYNGNRHDVLFLSPGILTIMEGGPAECQCKHLVEVLGLLSQLPVLFELSGITQTPP